MFEKLNQFNLHHQVAAEACPTLVFFTAEGCSACHYLKQILSQISKKNPPWRIFEVDAAQEMGLTREFEVFHLPALFLFHNGEFHAELQCEARIPAIESAVEAALQRPPQEAP